MTTKETGGPAFPMIRDVRHNADWDHEEGMTLRDWFAGQLLASVFSSHTRSAPSPSNIAEACYRIADAMIEARKL